MKIVIKIDENVFTRLFDNGTEDYAIVNDDLFAIAKAIRNGTLLPEHHGDLIDRSKICKAIPAEEDNCTGMGMTYDEMYAYNDGIDAMWNKLQNADPIIKADTRRDEE